MGVKSMTLREYIAGVSAHDMVGGKHPWYVFRGHPIPEGSEAAASLVKEPFCPTPEVLLDAFNMAAGGQPNPSRKLFVNAQWALGGEGTGAPVSYAS